MNPDLSSLEAQLRDLRPAPLDEALLSRLDAAADGTLAELTAEEIRFETGLRANRPAKLPADFLAELEGIVRGAPFAAEEKIVPFPHACPAVARRKRPRWAAAAAVALIGAASALLMPESKPISPIASQPPPQTSTPIPNTDNGGLVPAAFNRGVSEVRDEGIVWKSNNQPHNLVRVVYQDKATLKDRSGRIVEVERPRVEYMLVPARTD